MEKKEEKIYQKLGEMMYSFSARWYVVLQNDNDATIRAMITAREVGCFRRSMMAREEGTFKLSSFSKASFSLFSFLFLAASSASCAAQPNMLSMPLPTSFPMFPKSLASSFKSLSGLDWRGRVGLHLENRCRRHSFGRTGHSVFVQGGVFIRRF